MSIASVVTAIVVHQSAAFSVVGTDVLSDPPLIIPEGVVVSGALLELSEVVAISSVTLSVPVVVATSSAVAVVLDQSAAFSVVGTDVISMTPVVSAEAVVDTEDIVLSGVVAMSCVAR